MQDGYLGLGSNVGDRRANLQAAAAALPGHGVEVVESSSVYETEPVGEVLDQPDLLGGETYRSERLALPHAEVTSRRFVLVPLLELAPGLEVPGAGRAADALAALGDDAAVRRVGPPLALPLA